MSGELTSEKYLNSKVHKLSQTLRFSGYTLTRPESVSQHSAQLGILAVAIGEQLEKYGEKINFGNLALYAIYHDIEESITSDVVRVVKHYSSESKKIFNELGESAVDALSSELNSTILKRCWSDSKRDGMEGLLISLCDIIHCFSTTLQEVELYGNLSMLPVLEELDIDAGYSCIMNYYGNVADDEMSKSHSYLIGWMDDISMKRSRSVALAHSKFS